ncbi:MAG: glycerophosphodiester phosphodiesterase family protein [Balneolales bacterium]
MRVIKLINDPIPRFAWRRVILLWKPMATWTLLVWLSVAIILVPFFSSLLGWGIFREEQLVIGNEELINWILTPRGLIYAFLAGSLALMGGIIRYAGLFQIVTDSLEGRPVSVRGTALRIAPLIPKLFRISLLAILATFILLMPLIAGWGGIYVYFLEGHDINYYFTVNPPEWENALIAAGIWFLAWFIGAGWMFCRSLLVLPAFLSGEPSIRDAINQSWNLSQSQAHHLLLLMGVTLGLWLIASITLDASFLISAGFIIEWVAAITTSLRTLVLVIGLYTISTIAMGAIMGFFGFSLAATILTKFYYDNAGIKVDTQASHKLRRLPAQSIVYTRYWLTPSRIIPLSIFLFSASLALSNYMLEQIPEQHPVDIIAHRTGPPSTPENTLSALEVSIAINADYAEIDVQLTGDGVVVLSHDIDLMRVAGDSRRISESNYADLRNVIQLPDDGSPPSERRLISLLEFLDRAKGRIKLLIELKYYGYEPELASKVVALIQKKNMEDDVAMMSMNLDAIKQLSQLAPAIPRGYVSALAVGNMTLLPVDFLAITHQRVNPHLIRTAKQQGVKVYIWTVNRADLMADMMELGIHGIITDDPDLGVQVREELKSMTPAERLLLRFRKVFSEDILNQGP